MWWEVHDHKLCHISFLHDSSRVVPRGRFYIPISLFGYSTEEGNEVGMGWNTKAHLMGSMSWRVCTLIVSLLTVVLTLGGVDLQGTNTLPPFVEDTAEQEPLHIFYICYGNNDAMTSSIVESLVNILNAFEILESMVNVRNSCEVFFEQFHSSSQGLYSDSDELCHVRYSGEPILDRTCLLSIQQQHRRHVDYTGNCSIDEIIHFMNQRMGSFVPTSVSPENTQLKRVLDGEGASNHFSVDESGMSCDRVSLSNLSPHRFVNEYLLPQKPLVITGVNRFHGGEKEEETSLLSLLGSYMDSMVDAKLSPVGAFEGIERLSEWEGEKGTSQFIPSEVFRHLESPELVVVRAEHKRLKLKEVLDAIAEKYGACKYLNSTKQGKPFEPLNSVYVEGKGERGEERGEKGCPLPLNSVYVEYLALKWHLPRLLEALPLNAINQTLFSLFRHGESYLWLGDGLTVGKLHFDAYDNILMQLEGTKSTFDKLRSLSTHIFSSLTSEIHLHMNVFEAFRLIDPLRNERMYEGHMREGILTSVTGSESERTFHSPLLNLEFSRSKYFYVLMKSLYIAYYFSTTLSDKLLTAKLLEATSMVHSPVNIENPNVLRYPAAASGIHYMDCSVGEGEAIFVPSYWWHEVLCVSFLVQEANQLLRTLST